MRYRIKLAYDGSSYAGWQIQPNARTIQGEMERVLSKLWHQTIRVVGCGRTDAGVHAMNYWAHFDADLPQPEDFVMKANKNLPPSIQFLFTEPTSDSWHARFDAQRRTYQYIIGKERDPLQPYRFTYYQYDRLDLESLQSAANLISKYSEFKPFCKSRSDAQHYRCKIHQGLWTREPGHMVFKIEANRFLRGMVRLIVGACVNVSLGKITLEALDDALQEQKPLDPSWSVPAQGLFLSDIEYENMD